MAYTLIRNNARRRLHVHAAVDLDNLTGDVARHVGSKESSHIGDVLDLAAAAQRYLLAPFGTYILGEGSCHCGLDEAGSDSVGADAARTDLLGYALCQSDKAGLDRKSVV